MRLHQNKFLKFPLSFLVLAYSCVLSAETVGENIKQISESKILTERLTNEALVLEAESRVETAKLKNQVFGIKSSVQLKQLERYGTSGYKGRSLTTKPALPALSDKPASPPQSVVSTDKIEFIALRGDSPSSLKGYFNVNGVKKWLSVGDSVTASKKLSRISFKDAVIMTSSGVKETVALVGIGE